MATQESSNNFLSKNGVGGPTPTQQIKTSATNAMDRRMNRRWSTQTSVAKFVQNVVTITLSNIRKVLQQLHTKFQILRKQYEEKKIMLNITDIKKRLEKLLKENVKVVIAVGVCVTLFSSILTTVILDYRNSYGIFFEKRFRLLDESRESLRKYNKLKPDELHEIWFQTLKGLSPEKGNQDMSAIAIATVLNKMGASIEYSDSGTLVKKINAYIEVSLAGSYARYGGEITKGNLVIFKPTWTGRKQVYRIAIVEEVVGGYMKCMEYHPQLKTNFPAVKLNDSSVLMIVPISYEVWGGIILHNGVRVTRGLSGIHEGVDMKLSNPGREVFSFTSGKVIKVYTKYNEKRRWYPENSGGNCVVMKTMINGEEFEVRYLHLTNVQVKEGDTIKTDTLLGSYADIGYSFGAHVHVAMYNSKHVPVDPIEEIRVCASFVIFPGYGWQSVVAANTISETLL